MKRYARAFTLVELITVVAITGILITLIVIPIVQSFNLTRQAQAFANAQARARILTERIAEAASNAVAVRDNTGIKGSVTVIVPNSTGQQVPVTLPFAKMDLVHPAEGEPRRGPSGAFIDPRTGKEDPTLSSPKGDINLPLGHGITLERYFIGLRRPLNPSGTQGRYSNPYDALLTPQAAQPDNLYVVYRAEAQIYVYRPSGQRVVNRALFKDSDGDNVPDDLDDPAFFAFIPGVDYNPVNGVYTAEGNAKAQRIRNWLGQGYWDDPDDTDGTRFPRGRAVVVTEISRFDAIRPQFDKATRKVLYSVMTDVIEPGVSRERPRLISLAQFKPTRISNDPAEGKLAVRLGEEAENAAAIAPDTFTTDFGAWANSIVRLWPSDVNTGAPWTQGTPYLVGRRDPRNGQAGFAPGFSIYSFTPGGSAEESLDGSELFDVDTYEKALGGVFTNSRYPFSQAITQADSRSNWLVDPSLRANFVPFFPDSVGGKVIGGFGANEVGDPNLAPPAGNENNLPQLNTGAALSPSQSTGAGEPYSPDADAANYDVNGCFNRVWNEQASLRPDIHRFIDLRVAAHGDGTTVVLHPIRGFRRARIVPGSEEVFAPDQTPGANYGRTVRYMRTTRNPGPNQYRINYVDLPEPDYSLAGLPSPQPAYNPNDFVTAVIQPRYKAGYIQLNSDPNVPLPSGTVQVYFKFQFIRPNDSFAVDYDTRQVMSINLTVLNYPAGQTRIPQTVTLKTSATVRNFIR